MKLSKLIPITNYRFDANLLVYGILLLAIGLVEGSTVHRMLTGNRSGFIDGVLLAIPSLLIFDGIVVAGVAGVAMLIWLLSSVSNRLISTYSQRQYWSQVMSDVKVTFGPGRYFLGDVVLALTNDAEDFWAHLDSREGEIRVPGRPDCKFAVCATASGNGTYYDNMGRPYAVTAGSIGLVPECLWRTALDDPRGPLGRGLIINVNDNVDFDVEDGIFYVTVDGDIIIEIDTEPEGEDEDLYDEEDEEAVW